LTELDPGQHVRGQQFRRRRKLPGPGFSRASSTARGRENSPIPAGGSGSVSLSGAGWAQQQPGQSCSAAAVARRHRQRGDPLRHGHQKTPPGRPCRKGPRHVSRAPPERGGVDTLEAGACAPGRRHQPLPQGPRLRDQLVGNASPRIDTFGIWVWITAPWGGQTVIQFFGGFFFLCFL